MAFRPVGPGQAKAHDWPGGWKPGLPGKHRGRAGTSCRFRQDGGDGEDDDPLCESLKSDLANSGGKTQLIETTAAGWDRRQKRRAYARLASQKGTEFHVPDSVGNLRNAAAVAVLNACQVPQALFDDADGTSQRESWRRFAMGPLAGLAAIIESEISDKLIPVKFDFSGLWAHDIAGRAQAFNRLVQGGMSIEKAAGASGVLMMDE